MDFTPEFWKEYVAKRKAEFKTKKVANKKMWEEMSHYYKDFEKESSYNEIKELPLNFLKQKGILNNNLMVADICCGPGTHAIAFAKDCKSVFALDIAEDMLNILKEKMKNANITNITTQCSDFFKENFKNKYDLVFVSMSPILNELQTIDKLLELSKRYLFLIFWAGKRKNEVFEKCYTAVLKKNFKWDILDITVIFNYLYSLGYSPEIFYKNIVWTNNYDFERIYNHILWHLKFYKDEINEEEKNIVKEIVEQSEDFKTYLRIGFLFLDKKEI